MNIVLEPVSRPEMEAIAVTDGILSIGSEDAPFVALPDHLRARLAGRHAKLFQQEEAAYIVELGGDGRVTVNGQPVGKGARELHDGDELCIVPGLCFRVRMPRGDASETPDPACVLTLTPLDGDSEPIEVRKLPLLIGKRSGPFADHVAQHPEWARYLSRRHALLYLKQGVPHVEDLGSTNGTFVDGRRIAEQAVPLQPGATVAFGGDEISYQVQLSHLRENAQSREPGTILISAPDSFLDAFCAPLDEVNGEHVTGDEAASAREEGRGRAGSLRRAGRGAALRRAGRFVGELRKALAQDPAPSRRSRLWPWVIVAIISLMLAVPFTFYVIGGGDREIRNLMAEQRYMESAALANRHLKSNPGDENLRLLGTESLVKAVAPKWLQALEEGDQAAAERVLEQAREISEFNQQGLRAVALLEWMGRLERFMRERGGRDAPLVIFQHEEPISELVEWWEADPRGHRYLLNRVLSYAPELRGIATESVSRLVALQNETSVYLNAITKLSETILDHLTADRAGEVNAVLEGFERRYQAVAGMERLWSDLEHWTAIRDAIDARDLAQTVRLAEQIEFQTPPFRQAAEARLRPVLPPPAIVTEHDRATEAWRSGEWNAAFRILEDLIEKPWGTVAERRLQRYQEVLGEHRALLQARASPNYGRRLLAFYGGLHPEDDVRLRQALEQEYRQYRQAALANASEAYRQASGDWADYRSNGGIDGLMRLEDTVSDGFRAQATLLSEALAHAQHAAETYRLLRVDPPSEVGRLHEQIIAEVRRQRQWLEDMQIVLDTSLLNAKLALLPASQGKHTP